MTDRKFSREFLLAAACCRWPLSEEPIAAIRSLCETTIDWPDFLRVVRRQRVAGLVHNALIAAQIDLPSEVARQLAGLARQTASLSLTLVAETIRLQRAFDAAGIPVVVLKGSTLAQLVYGSFSIKHSRDIDLLVSPDHIESALQLLEGNGYALMAPARQLNKMQRDAVLRYGNELEFVHRGSNLNVDMHWRLARNPMLFRDIDAFSQTRKLVLSDGVSVSALSEDNLFAYLCVHGAHHAWSRLKWLADLNALIAPKDDADIVRLYRSSQVMGAGLCAGLALLLCHRLLQLRLPASLHDELQNNRRLDKLAAIALRAMMSPHAETELDPGLSGVARRVMRQFLLGQGWAYFSAQCRIDSVGLADVVRFPLPPSLHFLYPMMRLPLWLWRRGAAAIADRRGPGP